MEVLTVCPVRYPITSALLEAWYSQEIEIIPVFVGTGSFGLLVEVPRAQG